MEKLPNHRKRGLEEFEQSQTSSNRKCSGPKPNSKTTVDKNGILEGQRGYYNPDPLYRLIGPTNETELKIEGVRMKALIDSGAQISAISKSMAKTLGLPIRKLETLLDVEGGLLDQTYHIWGILNLD